MKSRTTDERNIRKDPTETKTLLEETSRVLLETFPSLMGFVASELRRHSEVNNPAHFRLLRALRRGPRSLHDLAERHGVRLPTMSRTVSVLEKREWIERVRSTEDRRTVYAHITEKGLETLREVEDRAAGRASELLECLSEEELGKLHDGLNALYGVVSEKLGSDVQEGAMAEDIHGCGEDGE
jgi:DNA-binding MarR family transcriptional regulator